MENSSCDRLSSSKPEVSPARWLSYQPATECDSDAYHGPEQWESDMRRQAVLERVGNCVFVRIRGSIFAREPEAAMRPVWQRIADLRISGSGPAPDGP